MTAGPILVVGSPRSGTSVLTWCVGQHPNVLPLPETVWMGPIVAPLAAAHEVGSARGRDSQLSAMGIERGAFLAAFGDAIHGVIAGHRRRFERRASGGGARNDAFRISRGEDEPKARWVDGTPENSFYVYDLSLLFPEAKFVHLVRDPHDVARSLLHFHSIGGARYRPGDAYREWMRNVRACVDAERALGAARMLRVRYEDMVARPEQTLERILRFAGERYAEDCVAPLGTRINDSRVDERAEPEPCDPVVLAEAEALAAEVAACDVPEEPDEAALARLEERLLLRAFGRGLRPRARSVLRHAAPRDAVVLVASGGENALLELEGRTGWHFPQDAWGRPVPPGTLSDEQLVEELERLRAAGAEFLLLPDGRGGDLVARPRFAEHLERWYPLVAAEAGAAAVRGLRGPGVGPPPAPAVDDAYAAHVERVRAAVAAAVPAEARVAVVSRGDDALLELPVARTLHFPAAPDGGWTGYHPADNDEVLAALETVLAAGATHLVVPQGERWWLDFYPQLRERLAARARLLASDADCLVFALGEPPLERVPVLEGPALTRHEPPSARATLAFTCNVCGGACTLPVDELHREAGRCPTCRSTVRSRAVVSTLTRELFGASLPLPDLPERRDLRGVGLTDCGGYAARLAERLDYVDTYYYHEPRLDLHAPPAQLLGVHDFVVASDVLEHVVPPLGPALANVRRLLKADGVLVLTVPWEPGDAVVEHYPDLHEWELVERDGTHVLRNVTAEGVVQEFDDPVFHGGAGLALEVRRFGLDGLLAALRAAGFTRVEVAPLDDLAHGAWWPQPWSRPLVARP